MIVQSLRGLNSLQSGERLIVDRANTQVYLQRGWRFVTSWRWQSIARWLVVGLCFTVGSIGLLYVLVDIVHIPLMVATLLAGEISTLLRFFINDLWVFKNRAPSWKGLWQYHCTNAGSFAIWGSISNLLPHWGIHYLVAATAGTAGAMGLSILSNFLWIWRKQS
jgi:putative flippase GtrA